MIRKSYIVRSATSTREVLKHTEYSLSLTLSLSLVLSLSPSLFSLSTNLLGPLRRRQPQQTENWSVGSTTSNRRPHLEYGLMISLFLGQTLGESIFVQRSVAHEAISGALLLESGEVEYVILFQSFSHPPYRAVGSSMARPLPDCR